MSAFYGIWHGPQGLEKISTRIHFRTQVLYDELKKMDIKIENNPNQYFDTLCINCSESGFSSSDFLIAEFHKIGINLRKINENFVGISMNETVSMMDLDDMIQHFALLRNKIPSEDVRYLSKDHFYDIKYRHHPENLKRTSKFM